MQATMFGDRDDLDDSDLRVGGTLELDHLGAATSGNCHGGARPLRQLFQWAQDTRMACEQG